MKTIILQGEQQKFEHLYKAITLDDKDNNKIPYEVEIRVYVADSEEDEYKPTMNDEDFMTLSEQGGRVYTIPTFQEAFNFGDVNTFTDVIRFISVKI